MKRYVHEEVARSVSRLSRAADTGGLPVTWCLLGRRGNSSMHVRASGPGAEYGTHASPCTAIRTPPAERHTDDRARASVTRPSDGQTSQRSSYRDHQGGGNETRVRFPPPLTADSQGFCKGGRERFNFRPPGLPASCPPTGRFPSPRTRRRWRSLCVSRLPGIDFVEVLDPQRRHVNAVGLHLCKRLRARPRRLRSVTPMTEHAHP